MNDDITISEDMRLHNNHTVVEEPPIKKALARRGPTYLDLDEACAVLAEMNIRLTRRQIKRSSEMDARGRRKLPWFIDPIEGRLKIEKNALLAAYFNRQVEAERKHND